MGKSPDKPLRKNPCSLLFDSSDRYGAMPTRQWGRIRAECRAAGRPISPQDAWIGATALRYGLSLITHNPKDFESIENIKIITMIG